MATKAEGLSCVCGNSSVYSMTVAIDGITVNELYCPECGIIMRSPSADKDGRWLRKHWANIHGRGKQKTMNDEEERWLERFEILIDELSELSEEIRLMQEAAER